MTFVRDADEPDHPHRRPRRQHRLLVLRRRRSRPGRLPERHVADVHLRRRAQPADRERWRHAAAHRALRRRRARSARSPTATATRRRSTATSTVTSRSSPTAPGKLMTVDTYDDRGDLDPARIGRSTARTNTSSATYDTFGRQLTVTDPLGHTTAKTYDAAGNVLTATDGNHAHDDVHVQHVRADAHRHRPDRAGDHRRPTTARATCSTETTPRPAPPRTTTTPTVCS